MISDAVKVARSNERIALVNATRDVLTNPAVTVLTGFVLIEYLQGHNENGKHVAGGGWFGSAAGSTLEAGLVAYLLAGSVTKFSENLKPVAESLAPLLLKAGV